MLRIVHMTDEEVITSATLLGVEMRHNHIKGTWLVLIPGARFWDDHFSSQASAARAALLAMLHPPK